MPVLNYVLPNEAIHAHLFACGLINEGDCSLGFHSDWSTSCMQQISSNICHWAPLWLQAGVTEMTKG